MQSDGAVARPNRPAGRVRADGPVVEAGGAPAPRGARPRSGPPRGAQGPAAQALHRRPARPAEAARQPPREGDQGDERAPGSAVGREHARGDERQDPEDPGHQGGPAPGEAAEQHEEVHGGAQGRADGAEPGEGEAQGHTREAARGSTKGDEWGESVEGAGEKAWRWQILRKKHCIIEYIE